MSHRVFIGISVSVWTAEQSYTQTTLNPQEDCDLQLIPELVNFPIKNEIQWNFSILDTTGTSQCVPIKGGVLISGGVLYTSLSSWDPGQCPDYLTCMCKG